MRGFGCGVNQQGQFYQFLLEDRSPLPSLVQFIYFHVGTDFSGTLREL
jgi:hypothetical protein